MPCTLPHLRTPSEWKLSVARRNSGAVACLMPPAAAAAAAVAATAAFGVSSGERFAAPVADQTTVPRQTSTHPTYDRHGHQPKTRCRPVAAATRVEQCARVPVHACEFGDGRSLFQVPLPVTEPLLPCLAAPAVMKQRRRRRRGRAETGGVTTKGCLQTPRCEACCAGITRWFTVHVPSPTRQGAFRFGIHVSRTQHDTSETDTCGEAAAVDGTRGEVQE